MEIWLNSIFLDESAATVSIRDTGLLHAAGVFTTMRAAKGRVFRLREHLKRLRDSCEALFVPLQYKDETLSDAVKELLERNDLPNARLRLTVTRGLAKEDPLHGLHLTPTVFLTAAPFEPYPAEYYQRGMTAILLDEQKLNPYDIQAGHKTLNYFSRLSALKTANTLRAGEALWFNVHNYLQSGSISNVFIVKDNTLITPPTQLEMREPAVKQAMPYSRSNVLPGVVRGAILEYAQQAKVQLAYGAITAADVLEADEIFITNSIMGVMPICRIEKKVIGHDRIGPITRALMDRLTSEIQDG